MRTLNIKRTNIKTTKMIEITLLKTKPLASTTIKYNGEKVIYIGYNKRMAIKRFRAKFGLKGKKLNVIEI